MKLNELKLKASHAGGLASEIKALGEMLELLKDGNLIHITITSRDEFRAQKSAEFLLTEGMKHTFEMIFRSQIKEAERQLKELGVEI